MYKRIIWFFIITGCIVFNNVIAKDLSDVFVDLETLIPSIELDIRYYTTDNFIGERIDGYESPKALLATQAAEALKNVQAELAVFGLGLKVYDAYRPQLTVDHFVRWAKNLNDIKMKLKYYTEVDKANLFTEGYIADRSGHSWVSSVAVTMVSLGNT